MAFFIAFATLLAVATVVLLIYIQVRKKRLLKLIGAELDHFPELPLIGAAFSFLGKDCAGEFNSTISIGFIGINRNIKEDEDRDIVKETGSHA